MKLAALAQQLAAWTETAVHLDEATCLHSKDRYSSCDACSSICPVSAIEPGQPPRLVQELCQDCRACLPVCPTGACLYTGRDAVDAVLSCVDSVGLRRIELLCGYSEHEASGSARADVGLRVRGCLAGLGVAVYVNLFAAGVEAVDVRVDACAGCSWTALAEDVTQQVMQARRLLDLWGAGDRLTLIERDDAASFKPRPLWQAESPPRSRRQLLAAIAGEDSALKKEGDGQRFYRERLRLVRGLRALPPVPPVAARAVSLEEMGFAALHVDETCTACGACARACPTEALTFTADDDSFWLGFEAQVCVACEACLHVCAPQAIGLDSAPSFAQVFDFDEPATLAQGKLTHCDQCGAGFAARIGGSLCPVCAFRERNPFGSFIPPGARLRRPRPGLSDGPKDGRSVARDN